jgi:hypothetical protein
MHTRYRYSGTTNTPQTKQNNKHTTNNINDKTQNNNNKTQHQQRKQQRKCKGRIGGTAERNNGK